MLMLEISFVQSLYLVSSLCFHHWHYYYLGKIIENSTFCFGLQVRVCREKTTGNVYAMKKLKKSEMLRRGQVRILRTYGSLFSFYLDLV